MVQGSAMESASTGPLASAGSGEAAVEAVVEPASVEMENTTADATANLGQVLHITSCVLGVSACIWLQHWLHQSMW